jgi:hypothetical protein
MPHLISQRRLEMPMTREQMLEYITAYESGDPVKDFYTRDQVQKWLYEFCLDGVQMTPPENREALIGFRGDEKPLAW